MWMRIAIGSGHGIHGFKAFSHERAVVRTQISSTWMFYPPYTDWTRKIANKAVGKYLNKDQAHDAQRWIDNDRRIRELLARLEQIGIQRLETDHT